MIKYLKLYIDGLFGGLLSPLTISIEMTILNTILFAMARHFSSENYYLLLLIMPFIYYAPYLALNNGKFVSLRSIFTYDEFNFGVRAEPPKFLKTMVLITNLIINTVAIVEIVLFTLEMIRIKHLSIMNWVIVIAVIPYVYAYLRSLINFSTKDESSF